MASPVGVAVAIFALVASLSGVGHFVASHPSGTTGSALLASMAISNQHSPAYMTVALHSEHNTWFKSWSVPIFSAESGLHSHASNTVFPLWKTNLYRP